MRLRSQRTTLSSTSGPISSDWLNPALSPPSFEEARHDGPRAHANVQAQSNPIARLTSAVFSLAPMWLALLILRLALARPFFASGLTRWDGWFNLAFGTKILFSEEYKLHIFGSEIPFPAPELVATMASTAEIVLPILLAFGFLTRWAALGLLCMTAVIQLTYPDGWANFHLYWAAMALAIMTFGPGPISIDRLLGLDGSSSGRRTG